MGKKNIPYIEETYDVVVVGAGHAGCEAALACARLGLDTMMSESSIRLPFARPRAIEPPMFPAPIMAIFIYAYF